MTKRPMRWKKGRGKLGLFDPLLGKWRAEADSEMGKVVCTRIFSRVLGGAYIQLTAKWEYEKGSYEEIALIGVRADEEIGFWSFTSDKKQSEGCLVEATDVHPQAIGFEAEMPAGKARMVYWPDEEVGFNWVVESKTKKGWNRFTEHHYTEVREE
jgi:hypothetical protein